MIISKANLEAVHTTKVDKNIPAIDNVHVAEDGSTIGIGGKMMLAVSPVKKEVKLKLNNVLQEKGKGGISIGSETVKAVIKSLPADRQFSGLLEHCNVERSKDDDTQVKITMTDGKRQKSIVGRLYTREFLPYKKLMRDAMTASSMGNEGKSLRLVLNLKRLLLLLQTIEKVAPDTSGDNPIWIEFTDKDYIVLRGLNMVTGQRVVGVMSPYEGTEGKWLELDEWEKSFIEDEKPKILKSKVKHKIVAGKKSIIGKKSIVKHKIK